MDSGYSKNNLAYDWTPSTGAAAMGLENARLVTVMVMLREFFQKKSNTDLASQFGEKLEPKQKGVQCSEFCLCFELVWFF